MDFKTATTEQLIEAGYTVKKLQPSTKRSARKSKRQGDAFWACAKAF